MNWSTEVRSCHGLLFVILSAILMEVLWKSKNNSARIRRVPVWESNLRSPIKRKLTLCHFNAASVPSHGKWLLMTVINCTQKCFACKLTVSAVQDLVWIGDSYSVGQEFPVCMETETTQYFYQNQVNRKVTFIILLCSVKLYFRTTFFWDTTPRHCVIGSWLRHIQPLDPWRWRHCVP